MNVTSLKFAAVAALAVVPVLASAVTPPPVDILGSDSFFVTPTGSTKTFVDFISTVDATFTSTGGDFAQKTVAGVTALGVATGSAGAEIDIGQKITVTFSAPILIPKFEIAFLFEGPEFSDFQEKAVVKATMLSGPALTGTLTAVFDSTPVGTTSTWLGTGFGTSSNLSPATASTAGLWRVDNPFGTWGWVTALEFTATAGMCGIGTCTSQSDYGINLITVAVPEPETYAMLFAGLLAVGWIVRRRQAVR